VRRTRLLLIALAGALSAASAPTAVAADDARPSGDARSTVAATPPAPGARTYAGPDRRWTVRGRWWARLDPGDVGRAERWFAQRSTDGWASASVPSVWNAADDSAASMAGGVAWYRRELRLPRLPRAERDGGRWILRFERTSVHATVWIGGRRILRHRGSLEPFEVAIPDRAIRRDGTVSIVVRTDSRRTASDLPPGVTLKDGTPSGGWWNEGGIPREVTLRRADQVDLESVQVTPDLLCRGCSGVLRTRVTVTNVTGGDRAALVTVRAAGRTMRLGPVRLRGGQTKVVTGTLKVPRPHVWTPTDPYLYGVTVDLTLRGKRPAARVGDRIARHRLRTGLRAVRVADGRLELNFRPVNLRGVGIHEQHHLRGGALTDGDQDRLLRQVRDLGGLLIRSHYPLHPRMYEQADRLGLLAWAEVPVYQVRSSELAKAWVRDAALGQLRTMIRTNAHHPSIITWSAGNELATVVGPSIRNYFRRAQRVRREMDPSRPLSYARQAGVHHGCRPDYSSIDLLGLNDYFGWYGAPTDPLADPYQLGPFLDMVRNCYPRQALMITEVGAEANRHGDRDEHGSYEFQSAFADHHFAVYRSRPWLSGAVWWGLREFRVRPNWAGGNTKPHPPWHGKGLLDRWGTPKPAWHTLRAEFAGVDQLAPPSLDPLVIPPSPKGVNGPVPPEATGDPTDVADVQGG